MGEQVGIEEQVRSQNNPRALENGSRDVPRGELRRNFLYPDLVAHLSSLTYRRAAWIHPVRAFPRQNGEPPSPCNRN
jgi:hypothetical protein